MQTIVNAHPHPAQAEIHKSTARFRVVDAGRRFGKTRLGVLECLEAAAMGKRAWWVAPSYKTANVGWRPLRRLASQIPGARVNLTEKNVTLPSGGEVSVRTADNPDSLRGEGLDLVVMDECAFIKPEAWSEALRPALSDRLGRGLFISTPRGRNWFWELYQRGVRGDDGWASFRYKTLDNPYILPSEVEDAKNLLPELIFRQEYEAEFIDSEGAVFRRIQESAVLDPLDAPITNRQYIAGVDVAASVDYTVVSVIDVQSQEQVFMDRFNRVDYNVLEDRLAALNERWHLDSLIIETNSIGQTVIDHLAERGIAIIPFTTTNATKDIAIRNLQAAFEHGRIKILNNPILIGELLSFESKRSVSGAFTYSAPEGMHDDCVMSLAIAWHGIDGGMWLIS